MSDFKSQIFAAFALAKEHEVYPVLCCEEDDLPELVAACEENYPEFQKRGLVPVVRLPSRAEADIGAWSLLMLTVCLMAERTSDATGVPGAEIVTEFTHQASAFLEASSPEELQRKLDRFFPIKHNAENN